MNVQKEEGLILGEQSWGNNPQESQYRSEVTRLLKLEIENVGKAVEDIEGRSENYDTLATVLGTGIVMSGVMKPRRLPVSATVT